MKIRDQEITLPASMFGNYPNPLWWDIYFTRFFSEEKQPPDTFDRKTWKDLMATLVHDQGGEIFDLTRCPIPGDSSFERSKQ